MITRQAAAFALSTVFLVCSILAIPGRGRTGGVSDPCKLLSEKEIHDTLGVASPVLLEPSSWSPEWTVHLVDAGFGNLGYDFVNTTWQKEDFSCLGRSGDLNLLIRVRPARFAEADDAQERKALQVLQKKWGYKIESTVRGAITCEERFAPPSDLIGWRRDGMFCFEASGYQRVSISVKPWMPMKKAPVAVENLEKLVAKAASRL
jgi:hypothetical protein